SLFDFTKRLAGNTLINKRLVESLILSGAFDKLHVNRRQAFESIDSAMSYAVSYANSASSSMDSLFAGLEDADSAGLQEPSLPDVRDWPQLQKLSHEKEVLSFYVSGHPLDEYVHEVEAFSQVKLGEIGEDAS